MANVIITLKIMPDASETDLEFIKKKAKEILAELHAEVGKEEFEPVAFGLNAVKLIFVRDEKLGGTDEIEERIARVEGVTSVEVVDVRRAIG